MAERRYQHILHDQLSVPKQLLMQYHKLGLTEPELIVVLHIHHYLVEGNEFPTPEEIADFVSFSTKDCADILRRLVQKRFLAIDQKLNERNILNESYSLEPLWTTLYQEEAPEEQPVYESIPDNLFVLFEQEFGRPLSPFEIETINIWLDQDEQQPSLIKAALREAVLMGKLNFKYIDRILREWKKKGIHSVEQARKEGKQFRTGKQDHEQAPPEKKRDVSLYYNWLEEDS
ncbi:DnaD domain-containing protein [Thalassobacillus sp. CUG 92003]|uniref:DnaD domain-containing protein n=1 Tax=Thalassobacillus sp. CUG 92003 TaxID=2736641 RepID=UPI0015E6EB48|nr:DnaD domain-containing protein [Thalassobacillus sp. CUG 92003]